MNTIKRLMTICAIVPCAFGMQNATGVAGVETVERVEPVTAGCEKVASAEAVKERFAGLRTAQVLMRRVCEQHPVLTGFGLGISFPVVARRASSAARCIARNVNSHVLVALGSSSLTGFAVWANNFVRNNEARNQRAIQFINEQKANVALLVREAKRAGQRTGELMKSGVQRARLFAGSQCAKMRQSWAAMSKASIIEDNQDLADGFRQSYSSL